jgi:hypothetical protein
VLNSVAAISLALPIVAHSQHAASPAARCGNPFPYGPEQFLKKLLVVAEEADPHGHVVAAKFQQVFAMKLRYEAREHEPDKLPTYEATECEWYAPVMIVAGVEPKPSPQEQTLLSVGDRLHPLLFHGAAADQCLLRGVAEKSIAAAGWQGGVVMTDTLNWLYRKGHAQLSFDAIGVQLAGPVVACLSDITLRYH